MYGGDVWLKSRGLCTYPTLGNQRRGSHFRSGYWHSHRGRARSFEPVRCPIQRTYCFTHSNTRKNRWGGYKKSWHRLGLWWAMTPPYVFPYKKGRGHISQWLIWNLLISYNDTKNIRSLYRRVYDWKAKNCVPLLDQMSCMAYLKTLTLVVLN